MHNLEGQEVSIILHTYPVSNNGDTIVKRYIKSKRQRVNLIAQAVQPDYAQYFNAVDRNDRGSSDDSLSMRTNR